LSFYRLGKTSGYLFASSKGVPFSCLGPRFFKGVLVVCCECPHVIRFVPHFCPANYPFSGTPILSPRCLRHFFLLLLGTDKSTCFFVVFIFFGPPPPPEKAGGLTPSTLPTGNFFTFSLSVVSTCNLSSFLSSMIFQNLSYSLGMIPPFSRCYRGQSLRFGVPLLLPPVSPWTALCHPFQTPVPWISEEFTHLTFLTCAAPCPGSLGL